MDTDVANHNVAETRDYKQPIIYSLL